MKITLRMVRMSEWLSSRKQTRNAGKDARRKEPSYTFGENAN
jgi:hypothetical protein